MTEVDASVEEESSPTHSPCMCSASMPQLPYIQLLPCRTSPLIRNASQQQQLTFMLLVLLFSFIYIAK